MSAGLDAQAMALSDDYYGMLGHELAYQRASDCDIPDSEGAMALAALGVVLGQIVLVGVAPQADEGTAAHLWQLLILVQAPIVVFFAIKYLPRNPRQYLPRIPRQALVTLLLQGIVVLAALAPVYVLHW